MKIVHISFEKENDGKKFPKQKGKSTKLKPAEETALTEQKG